MNCQTFEAAGVYQIALYNYKNVQFRRPDISKENEVDLVYGHNIAVFVGLYQSPKWSRNISFSSNYTELYNDEINFGVHGISQDIKNELSKIMLERDGWVVELSMKNGQNIIFQSPMFVDSDFEKDNDSFVWNVKLSYRVPTVLDYFTKLNSIFNTVSMILVGNGQVLAADNSGTVIIP